VTRFITRRPAASTFRKTVAYDLYWHFAAARQDIFFRRLEGASQPWTDDPILLNYKFTNAYRASDRVSQYLIRRVIYDDRYSMAPGELVFRVLLFKLFNKISTWELIEEQLGPPSWQSFDPDAYDRVLGAAMAAGSKLYSAAYIIPPVGLDKTKVKHRGHLKLIDLMLRGRFVGELERTKSLDAVFALLKSYPSLGDFLAFQLAIDLNYSPVIDHDEASFVVAGPGARDGLAKVFENAESAASEDLISFMMERQKEEFARLGINFKSLWGRELQLIDCQNLFCEISKYTRISNPELVGVSGRTRIKQMFKPQGLVAAPWYPPKWGLNEQIPRYPDVPTDLFSSAS
jgi:hypothetical protein